MKSEFLFTVFLFLVHFFTNLDCSSFASEELNKNGLSMQRCAKCAGNVPRPSALVSSTPYALDRVEEFG
jgi:hypothetical protein